MKWLSIFISIGIVGMLFVSGNDNPNKIAYVSPFNMYSYSYGDGNFSTIQEAVNFAGNNGVVIIRNGTYYTSHVEIFQNNLTLYGEGNVTLLWNNESWAWMFGLTGGNITIRDLNIISYDRNKQGIFIDSDRNKVYDVRINGSTGVIVYKGNGNEIVNNTITNTKIGIRFSVNSHQNLAENNVITGDSMSWFGVHIQYNSTNNTITKNTAINISGVVPNGGCNFYPVNCNNNAKGVNFYSQEGLYNIVTLNTFSTETTNTTDYEVVLTNTQSMVFENNYVCSIWINGTITNYLNNTCGTQTPTLTITRSIPLTHGWNLVSLPVAT